MSLARHPLSPQLPAAIIAERAPGFRPRLGLILGSGLGELAEAVETVEAIGYEELPGFPRPSVEGHVGRLVLGRLGGFPIACLQGRQHLYEGGDPTPIRILVRTLKLAGCEILLATNAAGSLILGAGPGSLMMLTDHINLLPTNPLVGPNDDDFGPRFPAMERAYDPALQLLLAAAAADAGVILHRGVYAACLGPSFETPAEVRALGRLGADAVGMSTVPEVILARHCGMRVAAISVLTNEAAGLGTAELSHAQTLEAASRAAGAMRGLITRFLERLAAGEGQA
ncbi:MAG: purine-nucleoside phosphorylase [Dongiaceae bacterium]